MCGIAAAYPPDADFITFALSEQQARGPDQADRADLGFCELGVTRLIITGGIRARQPLVSSDGLVTVVFNGAIYNSAELARRLELSLVAGNDGEVIHHLYQRFGLGFADHLEGMFAICIADAVRQELVMAVDPVGIKPMYRCDDGRRLYVASTMSAFPRRLWRGVYRVPPGSVSTATGRTRRVCRRYYSDGDVGTLLAASVLEQIPGEVKWGCMLSGGVDSAVIARLAADAAPAIDTFTCGTEDSSDLLAARKVSDLLGTTHHEVIVMPAELPGLVEEVVVATASCDPGVVLAGVGTYVVARAAREAGVKVLLTGEGADELFAGYRHDVNVPPTFLNAVLLQSQVDLGATECLRLDRTTMAHSVEARVPFLSTSLMRHVRALGPDEKLHQTAHGVITKYALRQFAATVFPPSVAHREKVGFGVGSGLSTELSRAAHELYPDYNVATIRGAFPSFPITDAFSAWVFSCWLHHYGPDLALDWESLVRRGLARQPSSRYLPNADDCVAYGRAP